MDRLEEIRIKNCAFLTHGEKDWLISEIERLRKENEIQSQDFKEVHSCVKKLIDMIDRLRDGKKQLKIEIEALKEE